MNLRDPLTVLNYYEQREESSFFYSYIRYSVVVLLLHTIIMDFSTDEGDKRRALSILRTCQRHDRGEISSYLC